MRNVSIAIRGRKEETMHKYSTTPLWNHVKKKHPDVLKKKKEVVQDHDESSCSSTTSVSVQLTLKQTIERKEMWSLDSEKAKKITRLICK